MLKKKIVGKPFFPDSKSTPDSFSYSFYESQTDGRTKRASHREKHGGFLTFKKKKKHCRCIENKFAVCFLFRSFLPPALYHSANASDICLLHVRARISPSRKSKRMRNLEARENPRVRTMHVIVSCALCRQTGDNIGSSSDLPSAAIVVFSFLKNLISLMCRHLDAVPAQSIYKIKM